MPVRKMPRYGAQKNIGKFASVKTGRIAWYESLLERDYMYLLDFDPQVRHWHEQPFKIRYILDNKTHFYTPDLEVHRDTRKQVVEVKSQHQVDSGEFDTIFRLSTSICAEEGYQYLVATDRIIRQQPKLDNVKKLWKYARTPILTQHQLLCAEFFLANNAKETELSDLLVFFKSKGVGPQVVYAMLFWGILIFNLVEPLDEFTAIKLTGYAGSMIRKVS
jgi:hypothetical protein